MVKPPACALILLAAGAATRMGQPKQLLAVQGQPLLRYLVEKSLTAPVTPIMVILGAQAAAIRPCLDGLPVEIVEHAGWAEGMGSSLRTGIAALAACSPASTGVIIALADEPNLSADHITALIETHRRTGQYQRGTHAPMPTCLIHRAETRILSWSAASRNPTAAGRANF